MLPEAFLIVKPLLGRPKSQLPKGSVSVRTTSQNGHLNTLVQTEGYRLIRSDRRKCRTSMTTVEGKVPSQLRLRIPRCLMRFLSAETDATMEKSVPRLFERGVHSRVLQHIFHSVKVGQGGVGREVLSL